MQELYTSLSDELKIRSIHARCLDAIAQLTAEAKSSTSAKNWQGTRNFDIAAIPWATTVILSILSVCK